MCMEQTFLSNQNQTISLWYQNISAKGNKSATNLSHQQDRETLLEKSNNVEEWIATLLSLESGLGISQMEEYWQAGLDKFHKSATYLEGIGLYYFRFGKHHKALKYLKKVGESGYSVVAIKVSITAAYTLAQYHLVLDHYNNLQQSDRDACEDELLSQIATSALYQGDFSLSEKLFTLLGKRKGMKKLPNLQESLLKNFGSQDSLQKFGKRMKETAQSAEKRKGVNLQDWIHFASFLMYEERYQEALDILTTVKEEKSYRLY